MFIAAIFRPTSMTNTTSTGRSGVAASWVPSRRPKPGQKRSSLRKKLLKGCLKFCLSISILLVFEVKKLPCRFCCSFFFLFSKEKTFSCWVSQLEDDLSFQFYNFEALNQWCMIHTSISTSTIPYVFARFIYVFARIHLLCGANLIILVSLRIWGLCVARHWKKDIACCFLSSLCFLFHFATSISVFPTRL